MVIIKIIELWCWYLVQNMYIHFLFQQLLKTVEWKGKGWPSKQFNDLQEIFSGPLTAFYVHTLWPWTSYHYPTSQVGLLSLSSKYHMQSVASSKYFATTLPIPHNQSAHLSTQTPFYKHYPSSSSTHNPSFLPRSTCPQFS